MAPMTVSCWMIWVGVAVGLAVFSMVDCADAGAVPTPKHCSSELLSLGDALPPRWRKICFALATLADNYPMLDERALRERDVGPLYDSGVKRQDVDHVFLRFGRRR